MQRCKWIGPSDHLTQFKFQLVLELVVHFLYTIGSVLKQIQQDGSSQRDPLASVLSGCRTINPSIHGQVESMDVNQRVQWMKENSKETYEEAKECMRTNYYGAKLVTEALLPLLQLSSSGRIVNVSSGFALLRVCIVNDAAG